jgi:hypothetical protein
MYVSNDHTYVCMHARLYACMYIVCMYVLHACIHTYCIYICTHTHTHTHTHTRMHTCVAAKDAFHVAHQGRSLEYSDMSGVGMTKQVRINSAQNLPVGA